MTCIFYHVERENDYAFYVWRAVWCLPNGSGRGLVQNFGGFFNQTKVRQQIGRKLSIQLVC
jgi:hypothetical protein